MLIPLYITTPLHIQAWKNCVPYSNWARSVAQNLWDTPNFSGADIFSCKKTKRSLDLQIYSRMGKKNENVTGTSK